jgi:CBS domain containing-hemolysin-like protein
VSDFFSAEHPEGTVSRAEMQALAEIGNEEGIFDERETRIFQNLLLLRDVKVEQIMTPRVVVRLANEALHVKEFMKNRKLLRYSRIPIYSENPDNIRGYVMRQQIFEKLASGNDDFSLADVNREALVYSPGRLLLDVWDGMLKKNEHIAFIIDEYGGLEGIVTMEDIIETLLGFEIIDETDEVPDMQQLARQRWEARKKRYPSLYTDDEN